MQFSIHHNVLAGGVNAVKGVVPPKSSLPVLGAVLLEAGEQGLTLTGTNLEMALTITVKAQVQEPGSIAVPARLLAELVAKLTGTLHFWTEPSPQPTLPEPESDEEANEQQAYLDNWQPPAPWVLHWRASAEDDEGTIEGYQAHEYPAVEWVAEGNGGTLISNWSGREFNRWVGAVGCAAATEDARPILTGTLIQWADDGPRLAAADGFRLAVLGEPLAPRGIDNAQAPQNSNAPTSQHPELLVPTVALETLAKLVSADEQITATRGNGVNVMFSASETGAKMLVRLIDGRFPNYVQIIPKASALRVRVDGRQLLQKLAVSLVYAKTGGHILRLHMEGDELTAAATSDNSGKADINVPMTVVANEAESWPFRIGIDGRYLRDAVAACVAMNPDGADVEIGFNTPGTPMVFRPAPVKGEQNPAFCTVVMPMQIMM